MKDELNGKLVEILTSIQSAAGKASDFAMEQLPDIAQSYVIYGRVAASIALLAWAIAAGAAILGFAYAWRKPWFSTYSWDHGKNRRADTNHMVLAMTGVLAVICLGALFATAAQSALVWFAPKVWLLKELASLVK